MTQASWLYGAQNKREGIFCLNLIISALWLLNSSCLIELKLIEVLVHTTPLVLIRHWAEICSWNASLKLKWGADCSGLHFFRTEIFKRTILQYSTSINYIFPLINVSQHCILQEIRNSKAICNSSSDRCFLLMTDQYIVSVTVALYHKDHYIIT